VRSDEVHLVEKGTHARFPAASEAELAGRQQGHAIMRVTFWGTRGSIAVPGRDTALYGGNTTCLEVDLQSGSKVIIDAGTGIRALGERLAATEKRTDIHLLITHIHWDHILGFPFFAPIHEPSSRILIDGFHTCMKGLRYMFDNRGADPRARRMGVPLAGRPCGARSRVKWLVLTRLRGRARYLTKSAPRFSPTRKRRRE
jgi:hypothetical protein